MRSFSRVTSVGFASAALALALGIATGASSLADPAATAAPSVAPSAVASPVAVVHTKDFKYAPTPLVVHVGDTVRFVNDDSASHTVTASDKSFDSGNMDQGATWTYTFTKAGTYDYTCAYHPFMKATIVVK